MKDTLYSEEQLQMLEKKLLSLVFIDAKGREKIPNKEQIEKMMTLCKKRNNPSYYKLRHASGLAEEYTFKNIDIYSDDGKKMRRFESGLVEE